MLKVKVCFSGLFACSLIFCLTILTGLYAKPANISRSIEDQHYFQRLHPDSAYHLYPGVRCGCVVQLQDLSKWEITPHKRALVELWQCNHDIFIKPTYSLLLPMSLVSYKYVLYNSTLNEAVEVKLLNKPPCLMDGIFEIVQIDKCLRLVQLSDNTWWNIDPEDRFFDKWQTGQRVFIGLNNKWRQAPYPQILINFDLKSVSHSLAIYCQSL